MKRQSGRSPEGPHTHLLPKLLQTGQTHAKTVPIPEHLVPCAHIHPPNPLVDIMGKPKPFDRKVYLDFQVLLRSFGDPELVSLKTRLLTALERGEKLGINLPKGRHVTATIKLAKRQFAVTNAESSRLDQMGKVQIGAENRHLSES